MMEKIKVLSFTQNKILFIFQSLPSTVVVLPRHTNDEHEDVLLFKNEGM